MVISDDMIESDLFRKTHSKNIDIKKKIGGQQKQKWQTKFDSIKSRITQACMNVYLVFTKILYVHVGYIWL